MAHDADAAVIGKITKISQPRWNSEDGRVFDGHKVDPPIEPALYRIVSVSVQRTLWESAVLHPESGNSIDVWTWGDGTRSGGEIEGDVVRENNMSGPLKQGGTNLLLLKWDSGIPWARGRHGGARRAVAIVDDFMGNWTIHGDSAVSLIPSRTVELDALVSKLIAERSARRRRGDPRGRDNPLE